MTNCLRLLLLVAATLGEQGMTGLDASLRSVLVPARASEWHIEQDGEWCKIRSADRGLCLLTHAVFVATGEPPLPDSAWREAGRKIGITERHAEIISLAADGASLGDPKVAVLRARLLRELLLDSR